MTVLLYPDHQTPLVSTFQFYRVGSKDEVMGNTGLAHFLEHLMFRGTSHFGPHHQYSKLWGSRTNAATSHDYTVYYNTLPSEYLEEALKLEADRMRHALFSLDIFETEKGSVKSEYKVNYENQITSLLHINTYELVFKDLFQPYSWPIIGYKNDIQKMTRKTVKDFYDQYYHPNNSVLSVGGNFDSKQVKRWIKKYYGSIPSQKIPQREVAQYSLDHYKGQGLKITYHKQAVVPLIMVAYPIYKESHEDSIPLEYLSWIFQEKSSLLHHSLIKKHKLVNSLSVYTRTIKEGGLLYFKLTLNPNSSYEKTLEVLNEEIENFKQKGVSKEIFQGFKRASLYNFIDTLKTTKSITRTMGYYEAQYKDYKEFFSQEKIYQSITSEQIREMAQKYLKKSHQTINIFLPDIMKGKNSDNRHYETKKNERKV